jgi:hypothetical protein
MSKWFYDTSPVTATKAAHEGFLIGRTKTFNAQGVSYEGTRWTQEFTWFGSPERNTLRPQENVSCCIVMCCSSLELNLPKKSKRTCLVLASARVFYSSRRSSYNKTQDPIGGLGEGKTLRSRALMARSSK